MQEYKGGIPLVNVISHPYSLPILALLRFHQVPCSSGHLRLNGDQLFLECVRKVCQCCSRSPGVIVRTLWKTIPPCQCNSVSLKANVRSLFVLFGDHVVIRCRAIKSHASPLPHASFLLAEQVYDTNLNNSTLKGESN